ncbi:MAG TPA: hypothetical protein VGW40_10585 [Allosphingosinicella sp.]|nr:hypothetical protein [Allosphingosinicella sp.]
MHSFNDALVSYLQNAGFTYQTSEDPGYRSPPDSNGVQTQFLNIKTIGCTPRAIVWSENVVSEDAFMITVHRTQNGTKASADGIASDLQRILANTLRNEPNPRHAMR